MTKTTTKYGIFGVVAIAAILSISLIVTATNAPSAQAVPANKVGWVEDNTDVIVTWLNGQDEQTDSVTIGPYEIHTSDKNDWLVTFWAECATTSEVQATGKKGKNSDTSGAQAGATATLYYDTERLSSWRICQEDLQIEADLNQLIEFVPGLNCDTDEDPLCGSLQFVCDEFDPITGEPNPDFLTEECQQWIKVYLGIAGSYSAAWVIMNMDAGHHDLKIVIDMDASASGDDTDPALDEPNGITSMVTIGNKVFVAEPIHIAQQDPLQ